MKIQLRQYEIKIDKDDIPLFEKLRWKVKIYGRETKLFYLVSCDKSCIFLHRAIMNAGKGQSVDHINGNGLDNRKKNLRLCTSSQNNFNRRVNAGKKFRGVSFRPDYSKINPWIMRFKFKRKHIHWKQFDSEERAAKAYDVLAKQYYGEFARLNFPM